MFDDPLDTVFALVEQAYMRMQAGDVLLDCLERENFSPIQKMVEDLFLAGPQSLGALREIRSEIGVRKTELQGDITRQFSSLEAKLNSFGVNLNGLPDSLAMRGLERAGFLGLLRQLGVLDEERQQECLRLIHDAKETMSVYARQVLLLEEMEFYLDDWLWGLIYQAAHQPGREGLHREHRPRLIQ